LLVVAGVGVDGGKFEGGPVEGLLPMLALIDEVPHFVEVGGERANVVAEGGLEVFDAPDGVVALGCLR
jgi:hypothetical protein